ncbi:integral membrane protein PTH11 [Fusarium heterosporum]|uniref:Integral membrane protein PTH11 n=1 Tax=Fusarium heterosporum TaxID=42747 RepID=A0A8H5TLK5_FUSHE|nr:integral membrane protein PTH11 [Fusarium heterosporum]
MAQAFPIYLPRQRALIATWVILPMLSTITVALRFYAKTKTRGVYGWTDWMIIASAFFTDLFFVLLLLMLVYGGIGIPGYPYTSTTEPTDVSLIHDQIGWGNNIVLVVAVYLCKASILFLYHRVFTGHNGPMHIIIYVASGITLVCFLGSFIGYLAAVRPIEKWWAWGDATAEQFLAMQNINIAYDSLTVFTDFLIFVLPLKSIWGLNMNRTKKIGIIISFCFGFITCFISLARVVFTHGYQWKNLYDEGTVWTLAGVEPVAGIICACLPGLRPLLPKTFKMTSYGTPANPSRFKTTGTTATDNVKKSINRDPNPFTVLNDDSSVTEFRHTVREVSSRSEVSDDYIELEERRPKAFDT